jgi:diphthine synthase
MVFFLPNWRPSSWYDRIRENRSIGLHTLILLDIKVKEQSLENMMRGNNIYEPPRYMTVSECCQQMLEIEVERKEEVYGPGSLAVGVSRLGSVDQKIVAGTIEELTQAELGAPLHSVVLIGSRVHELEIEFVRNFAINGDSFDDAYREMKK